MKEPDAENIGTGQEIVKVSAALRMQERAAGAGFYQRCVLKSKSIIWNQKLLLDPFDGVYRPTLPEAHLKAPLLKRVAV
jgi:hypothetical protein